MTVSDRKPPVALKLLGGFQLLHGSRSVQVPFSAQRVLGFLALRHQPVNRSYLAAVLWPESSEERAAACLRSTLWRIRRLQCPVLETTHSVVSLSPQVGIDVDEVSDSARALIAGRWQPDAATSAPVLASQLLPGWYEDWVVIERESLRQLTLHALESLCAELTRHGNYAEAIEAGLAAVASEPLRDSARRALIAAYIREGNQSEAARQFESFRRLLAEELDLAPTFSLTELGMAPSRM